MDSEEVVFTDEEARLLFDIYNNSMNSVKVLDINECILKETQYPMRVKELAFHLEKLRNAGYITYTDVKTFSKAGEIDEKYKNNAVVYYPSNDVAISEEGKEIIEDVEEFYEEEEGNESAVHENVNDEGNDDNQENEDEVEVITKKNKTTLRMKIGSFLGSLAKAVVVKTSADALVHSVALVMSHFVHFIG